jgi:asparagine synthase (glutamine-hydrolysing)
MCGIVGFNWEDSSKIKELAALLLHRGPEQDGFYVANGVSIGHQRLRIIDLSERGRQPLYNEDKSICITFNGEIFNFQHLREILIQKGHAFASRTDTEVLVHGYEEWGTGLVERINGQFAFCIFDSRKNQLFLARDRLGIKPLYYYSKNGKFIFGSELKVFFKSNVEKKIDSDALNYYLLFGNTPREKTILDGVKKLPPAFYLIYDLAEAKIQTIERYWDIEYNINADATEGEITRQLVPLVEQCVRRQLVSDVPLGAFLSGGLDSSIVVAMASKYVKELNTFSIKFDRLGFDESRYAKIVADKFHTNHHEIEFSAQNVRELIPQLVFYYDDPFADPSMIPTYLVSIVARKYVTVSLSGTGADELFGGYPRYNELPILRRLNALPRLLKTPLHGSVALINALFGNDKLNKLQSFLGEKEPAWQMYAKLFSYMFRSKDETQEKLSQLQYLSSYFASEDDRINAMNFDTHEYLPDCLLVKEDRASMAVTLEARVPLLDHELVEFSATIPSNLKMKYGRKKYILKKAFEGILPHETLHRRKQGFGVPLVHYFRDELKEMAYNEIFNFDDYEYYDKNSVKQLWEKHQRGHSDYSRLFWSIMMFNLWYKKWMR